MATGLCALASITDRKEGLIDRIKVAGVNTAEIVIAKVFTQFFIIFGQMVLLVILSVYIFDVSHLVYFV